MKAKRFLSMVIAAAMAMQCAAVSALAAESTVTPVANDIDTDWKMTFNSWERLEPAFDYYGDWTVTDGLTITHDGDKHKAIKDVVYYLTKDADGAWMEYNESEPSADYQAWYQKDAEGNPVAYGTEGSTAQLWYRKGRPNYYATFNVGETSNNGEPIVISFDYHSTNPATGAWVNGSNTAFTITGNSGLAFSLYNNADNKGFTIEHYDTTTSKSAKKYITTDWDYAAEHSVKVVISPELTSDGRFQMTAIELDGVVMQLEGIVGSTAGETDVLLKTFGYSSGNNVNSDYTDTVKNLKIQRGINPITVSSSLENGATDVTSKNITLTFSDTVALADGAVKVYENGTEMSSDSYTVTLGEDGKTADVAIASYKSKAKYRVVVDETLVTGLLGGELAEGLDISFTAAIIRNIVASDDTTNWAMQWSWERYEEGFDYHSDWAVEDGFVFNYYGDKYKAIDAVKYSTDANGNPVEATGEYKYSFRLDSDGKPVAYDENDTTSTAYHWYHQGRGNQIAKFDVNEASNNGEPLVISYTYKSTNTNTSCWGNGPATSVAINGAKEAFRLYPNYGGKGLQIKYYDTASSAAAYKALGVAKDDNYHDVKLVISPELTSDGRYQMTAISVDGVVTELEGVYGLNASQSDVVLTSLQYRSGFSSADYVDEIKDLSIQRGIDDVFVSSSVEDGATDVTPENITLTFSDAVALADGAVKVYENGVEMTSGYTAELGSDNKTVAVNIPAYKNRTAYKLVVDNTLVSGLLGGELAEGLEINFITAKKTTILEGSEGNLAEGYTVTASGYGAVGQKFTTVETDADGVTTITVDNDTWSKAEAANTDKSGDEVWEYDVDGDGTADKLGYASWGFSGVNFNNIADVKQSTEPLVISMDYAFENAGSNANDIWVNMGDSPKTMYMFTPFGEKPNVSGNSWNGTNYASGVTETDWHTVQYVIDPTLDKNNKTRISQITLDGEVIKDTSGSWISYGTAADTDAENGQYINSMSMRLKLVKSATDENGAYLPTVLKMKNLKVLRAKALNIAVDSDALTKTENVLALRFSDSVTASELANLKVMKGADVVENAIASIDLASDGMSAKLTMNLAATAKYTLVTSEVADIYGVKSSTAAIEFEYYNTTDGYVTIVEAAKADDGTNTTVSFTFTSSKNVTPLVIVAAYGEDLSLMGVDTKPVSLTASTNVSDSITLEKVTGAAKIQVMAWDSLEDMTPYCLAKDLD